MRIANCRRELMRRTLAKIKIAHAKIIGMPFGLCISLPLGKKLILKARKEPH